MRIFSCVGDIALQLRAHQSFSGLPVLIAISALPRFQQVAENELQAGRVLNYK
jgi:hypothetical protein